MSIRIAAYLRVSSEEQAKAGDSLRDQQERCLEYIQKRKEAVLQGTYIDDGVSGQKLERNEFDRLMEAVRQEEVDLIVFTKLDRWFRSLRHYLNIQALLEEHHVCWLAIDQPYFDTSSPHGRAFVNQSMTWAELEAQNDGIRIRDVFENKVKYGEVITGKVPKGYRIENKHLVPNEEAPMVSDLFDYFLRSQSLQSTLNYLKNSYGVIMSMDNLKHSVLRNQKYVGKCRGNDHYCPPLIPQEIFDRAGAILDSRSNIKSNQRYPYLFSGLLVCGECGCRMSGCQIYVSSRGKHHYRYPAYCCQSYRNSQGCHTKRKFRETVIEQYLLSLIEEETRNYTPCYRIENPGRPDHSRKKKSLENKLERLRELYLNGHISLTDYEERASAYQQLLEDISPASETLAVFSDLEVFLQKTPLQIYESFEQQEKRRFWRGVIKEVKIDLDPYGQWRYSPVFWQ